MGLPFSLCQMGSSLKADAEPVGGSQFRCFHVRRPLYKTGVTVQIQ